MFQVRAVFCEWLPWFLRMSRPDDCSNTPPFPIDASTYTLSVQTDAKNNGGQILMSITSVEHDVSPDDFDRHFAVATKILQQLEMIAIKTRADEKQASDSSDWKFAASALDRLCFWVLLIFQVNLTIIIFVLPKLRDYAEDKIADF